MKRMIRRVVLVTLWAMALATLGVLPLSASERYQIIDLGVGESLFIDNGGQVVVQGSPGHFVWKDGVKTDLPPYFYPTALNNRGQIVGDSFTASGGFLWEDGVMTDLGTLGGAWSHPSGINERGQIVGWADVCIPGPPPPGAPPGGCYPQVHAFLWENGVMTDLGVPTNFDPHNVRLADIRPIRINDRGQTVGSGWIVAFDSHSPWYFSFLWQDGVMAEMGGPCLFWAIDMNDRGQIVGHCGSDASLWQDGVVTDLGRLPGTDICYPAAINNRGQIVGYSWSSGLQFAHAFVWQDGVMTDLGTLPGTDMSYSTAINNRGQILGYSVNSGQGFAHAFVWKEGVMTDLGTLGGNSYASAINDRGQIVGSSRTASGEYHAVLWTPVISAAIEIKPGDSPNSINWKSKGKTPVAILSATDFNAPAEVDTTSLTFGRTGDELSLAFCNADGKDVNGDGLSDLVCHFYTKLTGFNCGDTQGIMKGKTISDGTPIEGKDSVKIVSCK